MKEYADALAEVDVILKYLDKEDYNKIPKEIIEIIDKNKNEEYFFDYDETIELKNQNLLPETKAILYNFFRDYLATPQQAQKIKEWQRRDRNNIEIQKQAEYKYKDIFSRQKKAEVIETTKEIVVYKENIFKSFFNKIKKIFKGKNV